MDILEKLNEIAGFTADEEISLYEVRTKKLLDGLRRATSYFLLLEPYFILNLILTP